MIRTILTTSIFCTMITTCGTAGNNLSKGGKCINNGAECHESETSPDPSSTSGGKTNGGIPGPVGASGSPGPAGSSCTTYQTATGAEIKCTDGSRSILSNGTPGAPGQPGTSCSVNPISGGAQIVCTDGSSVVITDGLPAPSSPYTITSVVDPCGPQTTYDEVLLKMSNGHLLAHFSSGSNQFLTEIGPGSYVTTDGSHCYFSVDNNLNIYNEHN